MGISTAHSQIQADSLSPTVIWRASATSIKPALGGIVLTVLFSLLCCREYNSVDGTSFFLYSDAGAGFRWVDLLLLGIIYPHVLWVLMTRRRLTSAPNAIMRPALLFFVAIAIAFMQGLYQEGSHLYFDWRNIVLGIGLAGIYVFWIQTPSDLRRAVKLLALIMGIRILYLLANYTLGRGTEGGVPGLRTPIYDGPTLNAAVFIVLLAFCYTRVQSLTVLHRSIWTFVGLSAFMLTLLSFRRTAWAEVVVGVLLLLLLTTRMRLATFAFLLLISIGTALIANEQLYLRIQSFNPFTSNTSAYTTTNEDHVGDVLDALDHVKENPVLGIGLGRPYTTKRIREWKTESWEVHNALIHVWLFYGMLGLIAYLWFHVGLFRWLNRVRSKHPDAHVQAFCQAGLAWIVGQFAITCGFAPWPYGALQTNVIAFFIIGGALSMQRGLMWSKQTNWRPN
jgi:hypothetical protein